MSTKSPKRFDEYIPLFKKDGDMRVALLLGELEDVAKAKRGKASRKNYEAGDIGLDEVTPGLQNKFFSLRDSSATATDTTVHPEWKDFMLQLGLRLAGTNFNDASKLDVIKKLKNPSDGSVEQFMLLVLSKIVKEVDVSIGTQADILAHNSLLDTITKFTFKDNAEKIITALTSDKVMDASDETKMLVNGLGLTAGNDLDPTGRSGSDMTTKYNETITSSRLSVKFANYVASTDGSTLLKSTAVTSARDNKSAFILVLIEFIKSLDIPKEFGYNYDKYFRSLLIGVSSTPLPVGPSAFFNEPDVNQGTYWRKADGSLWTRNKKGEDEQIDVNSDKFKELKVADKCMGTNVNNAGLPSGEKCADYLRECLSGGDITKCVKFLKNKDFWSNIEKEVDDMLPAIVLKTLEAFKFDKDDKYDESNGMNIAKVDSVDNWLAALNELSKTNPSKLSSADYADIAANEKLMAYLRLLVKKVNSNPAILNKGIVKSDEQKVNDPNAFSGSRLNEMGLKARIVAPTNGSSSVERLASLIKNDNNSTRLRMRLQGAFGMPGGSALSDELESNLSNENKQTWHILKTQYMALVGQLKNKNKSITEADTKKIDELFEQLKHAEVKLASVVLMTEKYNNLLSIHGQRDGNTVLSVDHLKEFVNQRKKYFERVNKKQNDLLSIIASVADAAQNEVSASDDSEVLTKKERLNLNGLLG
jgi:hypothetical protein